MEGGWGLWLRQRWRGFVRRTRPTVVSCWQSTVRDEVVGCLFEWRLQCGVRFPMEMARGVESEEEGSSGGEGEVEGDDRDQQELMAEHTIDLLLQGLTIQSSPPLTHTMRARLKLAIDLWWDPFGSSSDSGSEAGSEGSVVEGQGKQQQQCSREEAAARVEAFLRPFTGGQAAVQVERSLDSVHDSMYEQWCMEGGHCWESRDWAADSGCY